jgi:cell fate regulator YaaT (PSP1 superfamily)
MTPPGDAPDSVAGDAAPASDLGDGPDGGDASDGDEADDAGSAGAPGEAAAGGAEGAPRRRRRRRRRRGGEAAGGEAGERSADGSARPAQAHAPGRNEPARDGRVGDVNRSGRRDELSAVPSTDGPSRDDRPRDERREARSGGSGDRPRHEQRGDRPRNEPRGDRPRNEPRGAGLRDEQRGDRSRGDRSRDDRPRGDRQRDDANRAQPRDDANRAQPARSAENRAQPRGDDATGGADDPAGERHAPSAASFDSPMARLDPRRPFTPSDDLDLEGPTAPAIPWGKDEDGPPPDVVLAPDLPDDAPADDPDPVSFPLLGAASASLGDDVASVAGVRFVPGGRVQWCDAGEHDYAAGERVVVDTDRGTRLAWIAVAPSRKAVRDRGLRRVIRRASEQDLRGERTGDADRAHALRLAKDKAAALRLPLKVFRVEVLGQLGRGARLNVYYTSDERLDVREFIRDLSSAIGGRIELRQLGVRDEAKAVGGIGSCGLTLCCTTWLPDFVPVSIKMAKDQGLVLSPTKVSGQCGRLKCCLVYEQAGYAELRKGLPKLGKRVIGARGEARVVEVDVLRQRVRVSYGPGDTEVVAATEVRPMFPSGNQPRARGPAESDDSDDAPEGSDAGIDLPAGLEDPPEAAADPALAGQDHGDDGDHAADDTALPDDEPN